MRPHSAAILNIDADHLDCYRDIEDIIGAFGDFAQRISADGLLVVNHEDAFAMRAAQRAACRVATFGFESGADWRAGDPQAQQGCYSFNLLHKERILTTCRLNVPGRHNVGNALAAAALAFDAGAAPEKIAEAMATFEGVHRRMSLRGQGRGVTIIDDYAHHPTEIRATLSALRGRYAPKRTWVVFQPHQASRTRKLLDEFSRAFEEADVVLVADIYSVRDTEEDRQAVGSPRLVDRICSTGKASHYMPSFQAACDHLERNIAEGDVVVTMGAGDVWKVADGLVQRVC
jgi:UDP-N-acetylmuramate--alanine ligase